MFYDLHVHTSHSYDSKERMTAYCERAIQLGITHICFTDHIDMDPRDSGKGAYDLDAYFQELFRIRSQYAGKLAVLSGLEFAEPHIYRNLFERVKQYPFDYILGSLHWVRGFYPSMYPNSGWTIEQAYTYYWEEMNRMVETGGFDAVAHFDLPKRYVKRTVYEETPMRNILKTIIQNGLLLEVNTSSIRAGVDEPMPGYDLLEMYREAGGTSVTIGSDAHVRMDLGASMDIVHRELKRLGLRTGYFQSHKFIEKV